MSEKQLQKSDILSKDDILSKLSISDISLLVEKWPQALKCKKKQIEVRRMKYEMRKLIFS